MIARKYFITILFKIKFCRQILLSILIIEILFEKNMFNLILYLTVGLGLCQKKKKKHTNKMEINYVSKVNDAQFLVRKGRNEFS